MSFLAKLTFKDGGTEESSHNVLKCSFEFNVATDRRGKRIEDLRGGQITIQIESSDKDDFLQWMDDTQELRDGEILFYKRDMMATSKKITFSNADCTYYSEEFNADGDVPMRTRLIIAPHMMSIGETKIKLYDNGRDENG
jgi:hypothetical protein